MGGGASNLAADAADPEGAAVEADVPKVAEGAGALAEVSALLQAYDVSSKKELMALDFRYNQLKADGAQGFELLQGLHTEMERLRKVKKRETREQPRNAAEAAQKIMEMQRRVKILMREVRHENYKNFMVGVCGTEKSNIAYEVRYSGCYRRNQPRIFL